MAVHNPDRTAIIALLAEHGIDAHKVLDDDWNREGYFEIVLNADGTKAYDGENLETEWKLWPQGFPVAELERLYWRQGGAA